jgi:hypothetical protein
MAGVAALIAGVLARLAFDRAGVTATVGPPIAPD